MNYQLPIMMIIIHTLLIKQLTIMVLKFRKLIFCLLVTMVTVSTTFAQNDADPAITSFGFNASEVKEGSTTTLSLFFLNNGDVQNLPVGSIAILVSLTNNGEYLAEPEGPTAVLAGHAADMFTWSYNAGTKTLRGVLSTAVTPGDGGQIDITVKGAVEGENTSTVNIQRLMPIVLSGDNVANNTLPPAVLKVTKALPVTLSSFNVLKENTSANLSWSTTQETNSDKFEIQHGTDAKNWRSVGEVKSNQTSNSIKNYGFTHFNTVNGENYYRLKMIDLDGTFAFSNIRVIEIEKATISVYPNPVTDQLTINADLASISRVQVYTSNGVSVYDSGSKVTDKIDVRNFSNGIYLVRFFHLNGTSDTQKIAVGK